MTSYIDSINQATTAATGQSSSSNKDEAALGKQDFLMLLVAQLQNQDPLSPDDPTEFTAQLAQFSSLEQLFTLNETMDSMVQSNANADRFTTLNTIGKDVVYQSSSINFTGDPVEVGYQLDGPASEVTVSLQLNGATVATLNGTELTKGNHFLTWDGLADDGNIAPSGDYTIVLSVKAAEGESVAAAPLVQSTVTGVDLGGELGGTLITQSGQVSFNNILGVYEAGQNTQDSTSSEEEGDESESTAETVDSVTDAGETVPNMEKRM